MAELETSNPICRLNDRLHLLVGAVDRAQSRVSIFNYNPDSASIPEDVSVEFEGEVL
jgi:hypothetical protein